MKYLTYSGNSLVHGRLPDDAQIHYPPPTLPGLSIEQIPAALKEAVENPLESEPLQALVNNKSKVLIAFDDNCQPFPPMRRPDIRQVLIETLVDLLNSYGVREENLELVCAVALHRKMKAEELLSMLGPRLMQRFAPDQVRNFDAEDRKRIVDLGETEEGEPVETDRAVVESDLVIYVDTIQIPLNGGHKSVTVGLGTYRSIAPHHSPQMTAESPHVMQPDHSCMHESIERMSKIIQKHARIMVIEAPMNGATYPSYLSFLSKPPDRCSWLEKGLKELSPISVKLVPESIRRRIFRGIRSCYQPLELNAGSIDGVHAKTLKAVRRQIEVTVDHQYDTLVFGLPDLSPYSIDARVNPVLVVSDVLGYVVNWFYGQPFLRPGGCVIILNPGFEVFHPEYHVAYRKFWEEVLPQTKDPFEMQAVFQEAFARDTDLINCYRHRFAHHGFHPFTVWYWATYPLKYLSEVILVGPPEDRVARRLGISWAPNLDRALSRAREVSGGDQVVALTIPPFLYLNTPT